MVKILAVLVAALSILNSSGASPGATEEVAALVARATCSGASHSSAYMLKISMLSSSNKRSSVVIECLCEENKTNCMAGKTLILFMQEY